MLIIVSGFAGSGKSSLADSLGKSLTLEVIHASALLKEMWLSGSKDLEHNSVKKVNDWWESEEAKKIMANRKTDHSYDLALDEKLKKIAEKGNIILDSWTMPYLYKEKAFRVWLSASAEVRAKRVSKRDNLEYEKVLAKIKERDSQTKSLYETLYNFSMGDNLEVFDLVIDTDNVSQEKVFKKVSDKIKGVCVE